MYTVKLFDGLIIICKYVSLVTVTSVFVCVCTVQSSTPYPPPSHHPFLVKLSNIPSDRGEAGRSYNNSGGNILHILRMSLWRHSIHGIISILVGLISPLGKLGQIIPSCRGSKVHCSTKLSTA